MTAIQIAALLSPYKIVPRGTIWTRSEPPIIAPRETVRAPRRRDLPQNAPHESQQNLGNAPRGTIESSETTRNAPRGTISIDQPANAPRGAIHELPPIEWPQIHEKLAAYLDLILKWNARTNLTAIRDPDQIVRRHFGESVFTGLALAQAGFVPRGTTLLDFGSGAGFPGLPIQLLFPTLHVTLSESQGKKAAFLHEAVRLLGTQTEIWPQRVEAMPSDRRFNVVTLRAVDHMELAVEHALTRSSSTLAILAGTSARIALPDAADATQFPIPGSQDSALLLAHLS